MIDVYVAVQASFQANKRQCLCHLYAMLVMLHRSLRRAEKSEVCITLENHDSGEYREGSEMESLKK